MKEGLFESLGTVASADFQRMCQVRTHLQGARIFLRGQGARGIFVLGSGSAKLTVSNSRGRSVIVRIAETGDVVGLSAAMSNQPYEATCEALEVTQVKYLDRLDLYRFLHRHWEVYQRVVEYLSMELLAAYRNMTHNSPNKRTRAKLARLLLELAKSEPLSIPSISDAKCFRVRLTHREISGIIGSTRETVCRLLSEFRNQGLVETDWGFITLRDPIQLESLLD